MRVSGSGGEGTGFACADSGRSLDFTVLKAQNDASQHFDRIQLTEVFRGTINHKPRVTPQCEVTVSLL